MADDIKAKLESLKSLRGQMKDWKKDDLRKKKGIKDPEPKEQEDEKKEEQSEGESEGQPESTLAKLISKLMESK